MDYRISRRGGSEAIVDSQGRRYPISRSAVGGAVENASADEADVGAEGWAGTTRPPRAADRVLVFSGDLFLGASVPSLPRPDLEKRYGRGPGPGRLQAEGRGPRPLGAARAGVRDRERPGHAAEPAPGLLTRLR